MILLDGVSKKYGSFTAVHDISLEIGKGEIFALIGENAAGKTTILKLMAGLISPTAGKVSFDAVIPSIGVLIEEPGLFRTMTCFENVKLKMSLLGIYSEEKCLEYLRITGLEKAKERKAGTLSLGMRQRLGIAIALCGNPDLLILDEPINGLDPQGIADIRKLLISLKEKGMTIVISSHILEELAKVADRYAIIKDGRILETNSMAGMLNKNEYRLHLGVKFSDTVRGIFDRELKGKNVRVRIEKDYTEIIFPGQNENCDAAVQNLVRTLLNAGISVREFYADRENIEEHFIRLIGGETR